MKKIIAVSAIALSSALCSVNAHAYRTCHNGDVPKFKTSTVTYHVEPIMWDDVGTRRAIQQAFLDWSAATGWKLNFVVVRGSDAVKGDYNDQIFQVRSDWLRWEPDIRFRDGFRGALAQNVALSSRERGQQCYWWDNDIVFNKALFVDGVYTNSGKSTYSTMLHEIGHAIGMPHNSEISMVNPYRADIVAKGLYGYDIDFVRDLYDTYDVNLRRNFRADDVMLQSRIRDGDTEMFMTQFNNVGNFYTGPTGPLQTRLILPYNVTNESSYGDTVRIEFLGARNEWALQNTSPEVLHTIDKYIGAGATAYGWERFDVPRDVLGRVSKFGFRVVAYDTKPSDDFMMVQ